MAIPSARRLPEQLVQAKQVSPPSSLALISNPSPVVTGANQLTPHSNPSPSIHHFANNHQKQTSSQQHSSQQATQAGLRNKRPVGQSSNGAHFKSHQRRQSVARLLPDISKLRLLSWLVEASSELINCDIAIMDGVYAKLNKSQESLLFWAQSSSSPATNTASGKPPQPPKSQPVANRIVISQRKQQQLLASQSQAASRPRNHHSLPITNYDASSLAAVSCNSRASCSIDTDSILSGQTSVRLERLRSLQADANQADLSGCESEDENEEEEEDEDEEDELEDEDDDDQSSGSSSTRGVGISLSSASSSASSSPSCPSSLRNRNIKQQQQQQHQQQLQLQPAQVSLAEQLSEKIRRTVMEHSYLQNLLVNIIRQHDKQRNLMNERFNNLDIQSDTISGNLETNRHNQQQFSNRQLSQRIDLAAIADALDDGCLCTCHSERRPSSRSMTLPGSLSASAKDSPGNPKAPARKARRLKKIRGSGSSSSNHLNGQLNKQDLIHLLADRLCENCFETHYWLRACATFDEPALPGQQTSDSLDVTSNDTSRDQLGDRLDDINARIARRNATFIKLVQQEVRSTISKSIELIDLIRREIKSPEFIKQKQLMKCFSASIQLLTSVGNYVVPSQDISSFIPEVGQQQTTLFCLPPSDFDHLLLYHHHHPHHPGQASNDRYNNQNARGLSMPSGGSTTTTAATTKLNYHLASAPDIPIRRRSSGNTSNKLQPQSDSNASYPTAPMSNGNTDSNQQRLFGSSVQRLRAATASTTTTTNVTDSSSGVSSNNSSASSSIARGGVQQSSITRAQTASAILDRKTSHDLSTFEAIASLSRQQTEDDLMFQARPKFWQSSKFNFIKKLLHVKQQRLLRQQSKDRRIYNNKVQNKFRLVMMDLTHFNKSQQLLTTENGVNSLLTSMRNVLEFGLYLTLKLY